LPYFRAHKYPPQLVLWKICIIVKTNFKQYFEMENSCEAVQSPIIDTILEIGTILGYEKKR
jgi:hypothetical protein